MKKAQPDWLDKSLFPFESQWLDVNGNTIHYIDEGKGETMLFVHGTPEWSFGYREVIKLLAKSFRCIALDLLGFGLSEKPASADYTCKAHAKRLEKFIAQLNIGKFTIVANDFGGGIALSYAIDHPDEIKALVLSNTWMRSLVEDPHYAKPAKVMNTWLGKFLYLNMGFSVKVIMPAAYGNKKLLTKHIHDHYKRPLERGDRTATYTFAKELMNASPWWQSNWENLDIIKAKPFLFLWGMKDKFIPPSELQHWRERLPGIEVTTFDDAGHFVHEEKPIEMAAAIQGFVTRTSLAMKR